MDEIKRCWEMLDNNDKYSFEMIMKVQTAVSEKRIFMIVSFFIVAN